MVGSARRDRITAGLRQPTPDIGWSKEHNAELFGAEGRYEEAVGILERVIPVIDRSELDQAIGELYDLAEQRGPTVHWKQRALSAYLQSVQQGEVHYYHHLVDYYTDVAENRGEAVKWAYKDLQLRENFATQAALGWAFYPDGRLSDAVHWIERALASGVVDALLYFRPGEIYGAAGKEIEGRSLRERALSLNPTVAGFHVHHREVTKPGSHLQPSRRPYRRHWR